MAPGKRKQTGVALSVGLFVYDFQQIANIAVKRQADLQEDGGIILVHCVFTMPIPFATFIALFAIVLNLHIHNKHLTRRNAVTISIPAALLVYSAESHPKKGS